jgi:hypothetical protein
MQTKRNPRHMAYLFAHREKIETLTLGTLRDGVEDPTLFMLDPLDRRARLIAEASGESTAIANHVVEAQRRGAVPSLHWCMSRSRAARILAAEFPDISAMVAAPGIPGGYALVVVAEGSASVIELPPIKMLDGDGMPVFEIRS